MTEILEPVLRFLRIREARKFIKPGSSVCDIGCGKNYVFLKSIKNRIRYGIGIDMDAAGGENGNIRLISADIESEMPQIKMKLNHIAMLAVLEHMKNPEKILRKCHEMLAENGTVVITTPSIKSRKALEFLAGINLVSRKEINDHKHYFTCNELENILKYAGFEIIKMKTFEFGNNILAVGRKV